MSKKIFQDRQRTNALRSAEQRAILYLCERMPRRITSNILTAIGFAGGVVVFAGLMLATLHRAYLLLSILGLAIHWFGDSLDGRLAYFRQTPRKWFGFSLDINVDWTSVILIALGFYYYLPAYKIVAFLFAGAYGGAMILSLLRYKITDRYDIDSFRMGPTELRIVLAIVLLLEIFLPGTLLLFGIASSAGLIAMNLLETSRLLRQADRRDAEEKHKPSVRPAPAAE